MIDTNDIKSMIKSVYEYKRYVQFMNYQSQKEYPKGFIKKPLLKRISTKSVTLNGEQVDSFYLTKTLSTNGKPKKNYNCEVVVQDKIKELNNKDDIIKALFFVSKTTLDDYFQYSPDAKEVSLSEDDICSIIGRNDSSANVN